jgi:hypothetical protein
MNVPSAVWTSRTRRTGAALLVVAALGALALRPQAAVLDQLAPQGAGPTTSIGDQPTTTERDPTTTQSTTATTRPPNVTTTTAPASTVPPETTVPVTPPAEPPTDVNRDVPPAAPVNPPPPAPAPPWAWSITTTSAGYTSTNVGCATGTGAGALDAFFAARVGPLFGADYQHVVPLGGGRHAWFFQDAFIDPTGVASRLDQSHFVHNLVLVQEGACFTMLHRGTAARPLSFEPGNGEKPISKWFWPMGAHTAGNRLSMFWVEMVKDPYTPGPGDGLVWHPARTWLGVYDATTLQRLSFAPAPNSGAVPVYGYAVATDASYTYLFGNTFEQNLVREGGFFGGQHSGTAMYLARVPIGRLDLAPEYRTDVGWSLNPADARPFMRRYWAENPMQPRYLDGQWIAATKVDGYWGEELQIDVANNPWGPWTSTERRWLSPRGGDPAMNTYHAHLLPWRAGNGSAIVSVSQNARHMARDAFPNPHRYRIALFTTGFTKPPPDPVPTTTSTSTTSTTSTSTTTTTTTTTTAPSTTSTTTTTTIDPSSTTSLGSTTTSTSSPDP